ncbi:MAG: cytochrome c nitrite reductase small subunit [Planctomycetota bacterium JB042]
MTAGNGKAKHSRARTRLALALGGLLAGIGAYTFVYAEGASYLSRDPQACANCHIMQPQFDSWQKASHHGVATCVDCHIPVGFPHNLIAKAINGWNHSKAFTLQNFPEPIRITPPNARILQENCVRCHDDLTHGLVRGASTVGDTIRCTHCHQSAGHGEPVGLGGPFRPEELSESNR